MDWNKANSIAGIGTFVLTVVVVGLMVWPPHNQPPPSSQEASAMTTWLLPIILGSCLVLAAILHVVAAYVSRPKRDSSQRPAQSPDAIPQAQLCPDKWLHDAADYQKETLEHYFVKVERSLISQHDLLRESPYIDFMFLVSNYSVYKLSLGELSGSITYAGRLLSQAPIWADSSVKKLGVGRTECVIRQTLSKEDAAFILNMGGGFEFRGLKIGINGTPNFTDAAPKYLIFRDPIRHYELHKAYPQLEIEIQNVQLKGYWNMGESKDVWKAQQIGTVINIQMHFENPREKAITIQNFKLDTNPSVARITPAEKGKIFEDDITELQLVNLNECPFEAEHRHPFDGWLQFVLKGVMPEKLQGATPTIVIVDSSGQEHRWGTPALQRG